MVTFNRTLYNFNGVQAAFIQAVAAAEGGSPFHWQVVVNRVVLSTGNWRLLSDEKPSLADPH